jgi:Tol biopolymer transport system component
MIGRSIGPYQVVGKLGEGGMGEVYRARDAKLNRDVALKVLPDSLAGDPDRLARFRREAQVLASLNHPNIAHIHGFEDSGATHALVMELVEGPTLAERIAQGPIPLAEALPIARQIADALEAAHEQGIVHRDLKPANIKVRPDGTVKVLDFGLAKALDPATTSGADVMNSPTLTAHATQMGMILGTAAYMAPEQARGKPVDRRADIWAFGVVLYEMLTGQRAFDGDDVSITLASVLKEDVKWEALPADLPASVHRLLRRCLEKDPKRRLSAIGDARLEIEEALTAPGASDRSASIAGPRGGVTANRVAWSATAVLVLVCLWLVVGVRSSQTPPDRASLRYEVTPPFPASFQTVLSPDGTHLAATITGDAGPVLWIRPLDQLTGRILSGTEAARLPFWSPDSKSIAFFAGGKLKRMDLSGAPPRPLSDAAESWGGTWNRDGVIVFAPTAGPLFRVPAEGGTQTPVTTLDTSKQERSHQYPWFLPDGRHFLYLAVSHRPENSAIYVGLLGSAERKRLVGSAVKAVVASGYLLFMRQGSVFGEGTLLAQRFDVTSLELSGEPFPVLERVGVNEAVGTAGFTLSEAGILAHRVGTGTGSSTTPLTRLSWFDRKGKWLADVGDARRYRNPRLSPDGTRIVVETRDEGANSDLAVVDARGVASRFTFDGQDDSSAVWSPDGSRIAWRNGGTGGSPGELKALLQKTSNNVGREEKLAIENGPWVIDDWLPDGRGLLFHDGTTVGGSFGFRVLPLSGVGAPRLIGDAVSLVTHGRVSPDGRWLAFISVDQGKYDVYIQDFPAPTGRWRVSPAGGAYPVWNRNGKELFYLAPDEKLMAVSVKLANTAEIGTPVALFATRMERSGAQTGGMWHQYDVSPDATRFLVNTLVDAPVAAGSRPIVPITVTVNWIATLKK